MFEDKPAKEVAKRLGVAWPPANGWFAFKTPTQSKLKVMIVLMTEDEIVIGNVRFSLATAHAVIDGSTVTVQGVDNDVILQMRPKDKPQALVDKINNLAKSNGDPEVEAKRRARLEARKAQAMQAAEARVAQAMQAAAAAPPRILVAKFAPGIMSIKLYSNGDIEYSWGNQKGSVIGATARVDQSGSERIFRDTRQAFITIEGPHVSISQKLGSEGKFTVQAARQFCAKVNQVSQQLTAKQQAAPQPQPPATADIPEQIRELGELRDQGLLTDQEFASKKAELLTRL